MAEFGASGVVGSGGVRARNLRDVGRRYLEKLGVTVDEPRNKPGTGNLLDFRPLGSDSACRTPRRLDCKSPPASCQPARPRPRNGAFKSIVAADPVSTRRADLVVPGENEKYVDARLWQSVAGWACMWVTRQSAQPS